MTTTPGKRPTRTRRLEHIREYKKRKQVMSEEDGLREMLRRYLASPAPDLAPTGEYQWIA